MKKTNFFNQDVVLFAQQRLKNKLFLGCSRRGQKVVGKHGYVLCDFGRSSHDKNEANTYSSIFISAQRCCKIHRRGRGVKRSLRGKNPTASTEQRSQTVYVRVASEQNNSFVEGGKKVSNYIKRANKLLNWWKTACYLFSFDVATNGQCLGCLLPNEYTVWDYCICKLSLFSHYYCKQYHLAPAETFVCNEVVYIMQKTLFFSNGDCPCCNCTRGFFPLF